MSLLLCRREPVKEPYYIEVLDLHIYSSQELCYVMYNHPLLVMEDFVEEPLLAFVRDQLDMAFLAGRMEKLMEAGSRGEEVCLLFLTECDYYMEREVARFKAVTASYRGMHPAEYEKARADYFFSRHQYGRAAARYEKVLEYPREKPVDEAFAARAEKNLGAAYAMMFQFRKAYLAYDRAYETEKSSDVLKRIYFLTQFSEELEVKESYRALFREELKAQWDQEVAQARLDAEQAEEVRKLRAIFKKDTDARLEEAGSLVRRWKQEYRQMV